VLVVRNLTRNVQQGHLEEIFKQFGVVQKVTLPTDEKVRSRSRHSQSARPLPFPLLIPAR
jgi:RNA recognition motif-containing protein